MTNGTQKIVVCHPSLFNAFEIELYEEQILKNFESNEKDAAAFFKKYPKFLCLGNSKEVRHEVTLINSQTEATYRVDFFKRKYGNKYWDIIELKSPQAPFVVNPNSRHPYPSSEVTKAIHQAENYRDWVIEDTKTRDQLLRKGISVYRPEIIVVVGRHRSDPESKSIQKISDRIKKGPIEILTYTDIYEFAKEHYEDNKLIVIPCGFGSTREEVSQDILLAEGLKTTLSASFSQEFDGDTLPFSGRSVRWEITRIDAKRNKMDLTLFARRTIEQNMAMHAFREIVHQKYPDLEVNFLFDETSPLDFVRRKLWKSRKDLDGD